MGGGEMMDALFGCVTLRFRWERDGSGVTFYLSDEDGVSHGHTAVVTTGSGEIEPYELDFDRQGRIMSFGTYDVDRLHPELREQMSKDLDENEDWEDESPSGFWAEVD